MYIIAIVVVVAAFFYWKAQPRQASTALPLLGAKVTIGTHEYPVEIADTLTKQARGLSGRALLPMGTGMLFVFGKPKAQVFWMQGMEFNIDIIWISGGRVVGFAQNAPAPKGKTPATFSSPVPVDLVLEVPAGTVAADRITVSDIVQVVY